MKSIQVQNLLLAFLLTCFSVGFIYMGFKRRNSENYIIQFLLTMSAGAGMLLLAWLYYWRKVPESLFSGLPLLLFGAAFLLWRYLRERQMIEVKEKPEAFFTNSADAMYILNLDWTVMRVNPAFEEMFGVKEEEIKGRIIPYEFTMGEEERSLYIKQTAAGEVVRDIEVYILKQDGKRMAVSFTVSPIRDEYGRMVMLSGVIRDITVQKEYEQDLKESEYYYRIIAEHSNDYILVLSKNLMITYISPAVRNVLGYVPEEMKQKHFYTTVHEEDLKDIQKQVVHLLMEHNFVTVEYRVRNKQNEWIWIEARLIPMMNEKQKIDHIVVSTKDIRERKSYEAKLKQMAFLDSLTGMANRRAFEERLAYMMEQDESFALCYLDFDNFKMINDSFSHEGGDTFLKEVARRLQSVVRSSDLAARFGGDEFVLLIPTVQKDEMVIVGNRIIEAFQTPFLYKGEQITSTVSMGVALYPSDGEDENMLIQSADAALYQVKKTGRNNYYFYSDIF
ncbi:sensor domain-containing diguanylate cyclase [Ectobacillus panaciterrae]|uniref:sensor domain-containing diguanylate cyclase n=1 Tax=Ectobacillus panaciterrae TaxID=363872 RepID=UPI00041FC7FE|nr:sensor domain-containing diguanylate cyclase [Ectobacillus panaciterrae]